jgi:hypothetical protein
MLSVASGNNLVSKSDSSRVCKPIIAMGKVQAFQKEVASVFGANVNFVTVGVGNWKAVLHPCVTWEGYHFDVSNENSFRAY